MDDHKRTHKDSFKDAISGLIWVFKTQPNFRIHIILSILAMIFGWYFALSSTEMAIILFTIILGLTGELLNTSIEAMTDLITTEYRKEAKIAKDVGAGMMLVIAMGAFIVAVCIFVPYLFI